jgi:hypothetical protein
MKMVFSWGILGSLLLFPVTSSAQSTYNTETGYLAIPDVEVNGNTFYDDVGIRLNFTTGTFELVSGDERPEAGANPGGISTTPFESDSLENVLKLDFMGCERTGNENSRVTCHVNFTSLGGLDREVKIWSGGPTDSINSELYDSNGFVHYAISGTFGNVKTATFGIAKILLVAGVPTLAKYQFNNISPERSLSLFKPRFTIYDESYKSSFHP